MQNTKPVTRFFLLLTDYWQLTTDYYPQAVYTGGHPLEKGPKSLTLSHFSARPAWRPGVIVRSASAFIPSRSEWTCGLPERAKHHVGRRTRKSHIDFCLLFTITRAAIRKWKGLH